MVDLIGHVGYILLVTGTALVASKRRYGWIFRIFGEAIWVALGVVLGLTSVWFWGTVFLMIDFSGYIKWSPSANGQAP